MPRRAPLAIAVTALGVAMLRQANPAQATPPPLLAPLPAPSGSPGPQTSYFKGLNKSGQLFGNLFGIRPALSKHGITLSASETSELLGNVSGGLKKGFVYDGLTQADLQMDTQRAFGHYGGLVNISALQIHGGNLSANNLGTLQTSSGITADPSTRLWEAWYQQQLRTDNTLDIKIGQQSLDQEFMVNQNSLMFVNTMFGWPMLPSANMPGGGPAYPLSALGLRVRERPNPNVTLLGGIFNGNPSAPTGGDAQKSDHTGTSFPLNGGVLAIGEIQYTYPGLGSVVYGDRPERLTRTIKVGGWYNSENFSDPAIDENGLPLASPLSDGNARQHQGNYAVYGTLDQMLAQSQTNPYRTLNLFGRVMGTPLGAENTISFSADAGLTLHDPLPRRRDDTLGLGVGYTKVTNGAASSDGYIGQYGGSFNPVRGSETFVEATYQYQPHPWISIQPDIQYIFNPGAGIANPNIPTQRVKNEAVIGVRTTIQL